MEHHPGVSEKVIKEHEEAGELPLILTEILGALALAITHTEEIGNVSPEKRLLYWSLRVRGSEISDDMTVLSPGNLSPLLACRPLVSGIAVKEEGVDRKLVNDG